MSWTFGIEGFYEDDNYRVIERPLNYESQGYSFNPYIFDESGEQVVGCDEYDVFNRKYLPLLLAAPDLLTTLEDVLSAVEPLHVQGYHYIDKANSLISKIKGGLNGQDL